MVYRFIIYRFLVKKHMIVLPSKLLQLKLRVIYNPWNVTVDLPRNLLSKQGR